MVELELIPFDDGSRPPVDFLRVSLTPGPVDCRIVYRLRGRLDALRLPPPAPPERHDELWKHTCFELFVAATGTPGYREFNFSPAGHWAAYEFSGYRAGMAALSLESAPEIVVTRGSDEFTLTVRLPRIAPSGRAALTAVIEDSHGKLSYWALRHPAARPDFHADAGFALDLGLS